MANNKALSERERRFVDAYLGRARGNGTQAAILAGYSKNGADVVAARLLGKVRVRQAVQAKVAKLEEKGIATAAEIDGVLSQAVRDTEAAWVDRIAAARELNKVTGRHVVRIEGQIDIEHHVTADALARLSDAELLAVIEREKADLLALEAEVRATLAPKAIAGTVVGQNLCLPAATNCSPDGPRAGCRSWSGRHSRAE